MRAVRYVLLVTLALNLLVAGAKLVVGHMFHVVSLTADGVHSSLDGFNNVAALVAMTFAARPPDPSHPYGHRKYETFAAIGIGVVLLTVGVGVVREAIGRIGATTVPITHPATFAVTLGTLGVNVWVARWEAARGRALGSELLVADAHHTASDIGVSAAVLAALVAIALHAPWLDFVAALVIAAIIARAAYAVLASGIRVLSDAAAVDRARIEAITRGVEGVRDCHHVRTRGPEGHVFVDLHIQVDAHLTTAASHAIAHGVADTIRAQIAGVVEVLVHTEPYDGAPDSGPIEAAPVATPADGAPLSKEPPQRLALKPPPKRLTPGSGSPSRRP